MPIATQFVLSLESKPGVLARIAKAFGSKGVNIKAFCAWEQSGQSAGKDNMRVLVSDVEKGRAALTSEKIDYYEEQALVLSLENEPGALGTVAQHLRDAHVNITCGYCTPSREGKRAIVVLSVSDVKKAQEVLRGESLDEI